MLNWIWVFFQSETTSLTIPVLTIAPLCGGLADGSPVRVQVGRPCPDRRNDQIQHILCSVCDIQQDDLFGLLGIRWCPEYVQKSKSHPAAVWRIATGDLKNVCPSDSCRSALWKTIFFPSSSIVRQRVSSKCEAIVNIIFFFLPVRRRPLETSGFPVSPQSVQLKSNYCPKELFQSCEFAVDCWDISSLGSHRLSHVWALSRLSSTLCLQQKTQTKDSRSFQSDRSSVPFKTRKDAAALDVKTNVALIYLKKKICVYDVDLWEEREMEGEDSVIVASF